MGRGEKKSEKGALRRKDSANELAQFHEDLVKLPGRKIGGKYRGQDYLSSPRDTGMSRDDDGGSP